MGTILRRVTQHFGVVEANESVYLLHTSRRIIICLLACVISLFYTIAVNGQACPVNAGTLSQGSVSSCLEIHTTTTVSATVNNDAVIPQGFSQIYVLTLGSNLIIQQTNNTPVFSINNPGLYTIHSLVYNPTTLDLTSIVMGVTTGALSLIHI